jgi:trehalose 2-sulfotransferase
MTASSSGPSVPPIRLSYVICTTPRSGSNFHCEVLHSTGVAGRPDEYFWNDAFWQERLGIPDFAGYVERVFQDGTSPNGVFGVKLMWSYLDDLLPRLAEVAGLTGADPPAVLPAIFPNPRYLWLIRRDKVRQGISWYRAWKSDTWRSTGHRPGPDVEPAFGYPEIKGLVEQAIRSDRSWQAYFEQYAVEPLIVTYEDLAADPGGGALQILRHLGLPPPAPPWPPAWRHQRQADARTDNWVRQYHALKAEGDDGSVAELAPPLPRAGEGAGG